MANVRNQLSLEAELQLVTNGLTEQPAVILETSMAYDPLYRRAVEHFEGSGQNGEMAVDKCTDDQSSSVAKVVEAKLLSVNGQDKENPVKTPYGLTGRDIKAMRFAGKIRPRGPANQTDSGKPKPGPKPGNPKPKPNGGTKQA